MATIKLWPLLQDATTEANMITAHPPISFIIIAAAVTILLIIIIAYRCYRLRRCDCCDEEEDDERQTLLPHGSGFSCLRKTSTYYQWNQTPPSCQRSPISPEKSWEHRRSALLKKYAAVVVED